MAKFVITGRADCPRYARAELLADKLSASLPHFKVHKIVHSGSDWPSWLSDQCTASGWSHSSGSPLIWRELVDRGGKGHYLGGLDEFVKYASHYYNVSPTTSYKDELKIASENQSTFENDLLKAANMPRVEPLRVCITNATSPVAYHLSEQIATGQVYGNKVMVALHLYDNSPEKLPELEGLKMELDDLASPVLAEVVTACTLKQALNSVKTVFILDFPYQGSELSKVTGTLSVVQEYHNYAKSIDFSTRKDVHIIVSGCYSNMGAAIIAKYASSIPRSKVIAAPCLVEQQAKAILASKIHVNGADIDQVCVWGRTHGDDVLVDIANTRVRHFNGSIVGPDPFSLPVSRCVFEADWVEKVFPTVLSDRHGAMMGYHNTRAPLTEAIGLGRLARRWEHSGEVWVPVGVVSEGGEEYYGVPEGVVFSLPAQSNKGEWQIMTGLTITKDIKIGITEQIYSLKAELDKALKLITEDPK